MVENATAHESEEGAIRQTKAPVRGGQSSHVSGDISLFWGILGRVYTNRCSDWSAVTPRCLRASKLEVAVGLWICGG